MRRELFSILGSIAAAAVLIGLSMQLGSDAASRHTRDVGARRSDVQDNIIVINPADHGPGTLRQALIDAQDGDSIAFSPTHFPPHAPVSIMLDDVLPGIFADHLTITGEGSGVILDGTNLPETHLTGIEVVSAVSVTIEGLEITGFHGAAIGLPKATDCLVRNNLLWGNNIGVLVSDGDASGNVIKDNESRDGNIGVYVSEGAHDILIKGNTIYDNEEFGVAITHQGSLAQVTENLIYDNGDAGLHNTNTWRGIFIEGPEDPPPPPLITDFNLTSGQAAGVSCPRCRVEVFSSEKGQGQSYAGSATADGSGEFALSGLTFDYDHLTATATDGSMTGPFSEPTTGTQQVYVLQLANPHPKKQFVGTRPEEAFNGLGEMYSLSPTVFDATPEQFVGQAMDAGLTWERVSIDEFDFHEDWAEQTGRAACSTCEIWDKQKESLELLQQNNFTVMYVLLFWDEQIEPNLDDPGYERFADQEEIDRFISYATCIVENLGQYIDWYEIWNEPETPDPGQQITAENYVNVVEQLMPVIRALDPSAKIAVGATPEYGLLGDIIQSEVISDVDGISWHPFYGNAPGLDLEGWPADYWESYPSILRDEIKAEATLHGFTGEFIAEELNWLTPKNQPPMGFAGHEPVPAAKYLSRAIVLHRGMDAWSGLAESLTTHPKRRVVRNLADLLAGAEPHQIKVSIPTSVTDAVSYALAKPTRDTVAFWEEGVAGPRAVPTSVTSLVTATLTLTTDIESSVTAFIVDPLNGLRQEAVIVQEETDGPLVLPGLTLADYPLIIQVSAEHRVYLPAVTKKL